MPFLPPIAHFSFIQFTSSASFHSVRNRYPLQLWKVEQKGKGKKKPTSQLLAFGLTSLGIKLQNSDDTGGRNEKHLSLGHHSRKRIAFPPPPPIPLLLHNCSGSRERRRWQELCKRLAVIYGKQKCCSRLHLSYACKKEKASFQNISITGGRRQKGSDSGKESKDAL